MTSHPYTPPFTLSAKVVALVAEIVARGLPVARDRDDAISRARAAFDWEKQFEVALDPPHARARWLKTRACQEGAPTDDHCSMCGKQFCAMRTTRRIREKSTIDFPPKHL